MTRAFFCGSELLRYITHTNVVVLPKKEMVKDFSNLRPIGLSNFTNKILSRLVHTRIAGVLPDIISVNQSSFIKGRSISENMFLAQ